ncbi:hypothetical protein KIH39_01880 [Telmatocola sphagniphila]|uniref:Uncharacterized protein n=1 Tax=Telmatocola sphagniphila TaxID=1123043 RepID=A0A8E6EYI5_9BACT|nr:hypothetical protein [Telmatocola sphagniphila]QVL32693.1 hypothetical protein KIH39_01880 [Telmatocola sphagniphila]
MLRDFQSLIDWPCSVSKRLGQDLKRQSQTMFGLWKCVRDGHLKRLEFQKRMLPIRSQIEALLL